MAMLTACNGQPRHASIEPETSRAFLAANIQVYYASLENEKNDIVLIQPTCSSASDPPDFLLPSITQFLQNSCGML
jgi:hypothetical protein